MFFDNKENSYVSRGGIKLAHALLQFEINVRGLVVLDVGSSTGGFVDCLLQNGATVVYSLDTAYGELAWKLRQDARVVKIEKKNILTIQENELSVKFDLITVDVTFTPLNKVLSTIRKFLKPKGQVVALYKPQYENSRIALKHGGVIPKNLLPVFIQKIKEFVEIDDWKILGLIDSPILGKDGNQEFLIYLYANN